MQSLSDRKPSCRSNSRSEPPNGIASRIEHESALELQPALNMVSFLMFSCCYCCGTAHISGLAATARHSLGASPLSGLCSNLCSMVGAMEAKSALWSHSLYAGSRAGAASIMSISCTWLSGSGPGRPAS